MNPVLHRLKETFDVPLEEQPSQWNSLWEDDFMPWDQGIPSPALVDLLGSERPTNSTGAAAAAIKEARKRPNQIAIVPGCGKGYDVKLLAENGYNAFGADIAEKAIELAREWYAGNKLEGEGQDGKGKVGFVVGDYFKDDWVKDVVLGGKGEVEGSVGLIYDYTFLCALNPSLRPKWAKQMANLLAKGTGLLICLEFPLYKAFELQGPPWGLRSYIYDELLQENFELVERYKPERTHEMGEGTDMIAVWRRKA